MIEKSLPKGKAWGNKKRPWIGLQERVIGCIGKAVGSNSVLPEPG